MAAKKPTPSSRPLPQRLHSKPDPKGGLTDLTRDRGWDCLTAAGLRPVAQIAVNETWSALRFRPGPPRSRA